MQKSSSTPALDVDRLVDLRSGYSTLGTSVAQGIRREGEPGFAHWPRRFVVGVGKDGRQICALRLSHIRAYLESLPVAEKPKKKNPVLVARGSEGGRKAKAKRDKARADLQAESAFQREKTRGNGTSTRTRTRRVQ